DPATGRASGGARRPQDLRELFPQLFLALSSDLGSDSVVLSLLVHTPYAQRYSYLSGEGGKLFDPTLQGPGRYHAVDLTQFHLFVTTAASLKIIDSLSVGVAVSYVFGSMDFGFVHDAALEGGRARDEGEYVALDDCGGGASCGYGANAAAEAVRVRGQAHGVAFGVGLLGRPHRAVDVGLGWVSRVVGIGGERIPAKGDAWVRRSQASFDNALADPDLAGTTVARDLEGRGTVHYALPDMLFLGATWRVRSWLALNLQAHWIDLSAHDRLDIRLTGTQFRARPLLPDRLVHYRGYQDVFGAQLGIGWTLSSRLELQLASLVESAGLPMEATSIAAIDAIKVDSLLALRWQVTRRLTVRAGYGLVLMPAVQTLDSVFAPSEMVSCVESHYDVELPECRRAAEGRGLASAAGRYRLTTHRFSLGLSYDAW
ncbi:MAG: outer membrane protein transport protein, partial [Acidobacteriota bacterium]